MLISSDASASSLQPIEETGDDDPSRNDNGSSISDDPATRISPYETTMMMWIPMPKNTSKTSSGSESQQLTPTVHCDLVSEEGQPRPANCETMKRKKSTTNAKMSQDIGMEEKSYKVRTIRYEGCFFVCYGLY